jgi:SH3 type 3 domain protein
MSENNNNTIKILIAIIISLSMVIVINGIFYILNMQNKIAKLEIEQKEQSKQQLKISNAPSSETIEPQNITENHKQIQQIQEKKSRKTVSNKNSLGNTKKRNSKRQKVNTREIERTIDDTINQLDNNSNSKEEEDKLTRNIENVMGE